VDYSERSIARKLGDLCDRQQESIRDLILSRGGTGANVKMAGVWAEGSLRDAAIAAMNGNTEAEKAVKLVKQARRLGQAY
jgi:hypothetical protein